MTEKPILARQHIINAENAITDLDALIANSVPMAALGPAVELLRRIRADLEAARRIIANATCDVDTANSRM